MTKLVALAAVASLAVTSVAHADPGDEGPKDPNTALLLSLGGTAVSGALFLAGTHMDYEQGDHLIEAGLLSSLVTPSLGEWYAGKPLTVGMGIRGASALAEMYGLAEAFSCWDECSNNDNDTAGVLIVGGLIGYGAGIIYDIVDAPNAARAYNRAHATWQVVPTVMRTPSGDMHMGVGIGGAF
jgi:hypothetical protein